MYKKLLDENSKYFAGLNHFIFNLRREVSLWKLITGALCIFIIFLFFQKNKNNLLNKSFNDETKPITTKQISQLNKNIIAEIKIEGPIFSNHRTEKLLDEIYKSNKIKGLLIVIDSPGGDPAASEVLYNKIKKIQKNIPVVSFVQGYGTSGAYMIAMAAKKIVSIRSGMVGSIGVIGGEYDYTELMKKVGIGYTEYASSKYKGAGNPLVKTTEVQKKYRQDILMQIYDIFRDMVQEARSLSKIELDKVANAKVFLGKEALKLKLIDRIGSKDTAIEIIKTQLAKEKLDDLEIQEIEREQAKNNGFLNMSTYLTKFVTQLKLAIQNKHITQMIN